MARILHSFPVRRSVLSSSRAAFAGNGLQVGPAEYYDDEETRCTETLVARGEDGFDLPAQIALHQGRPDSCQSHGQQEGQPQRHRLGNPNGAILHQPGGQEFAAQAKEGTGKGQEYPSGAGAPTKATSGTMRIHGDCLGHMEDFIRFLAGGITVSVFAVMGDVFRPRSFAGMFAAAPTIALATLGLALAKHGAEIVSIEGRSMVIGAVALSIHSLLTSHLLLRHNWSALPAALVPLAGWFVVSFGLWTLFLRGGAP